MKCFATWMHRYKRKPFVKNVRILTMNNLPNERKNCEWIPSTYQPQNLRLNYALQRFDTGQQRSEFDVRRCVSESVNIAKRVFVILENMQTYGSLTWMEVTSFLGLELLSGSAAFSGSTATRLRLSRATLYLIVIVTEPDISPPQHPDFFHARPRRLCLPHLEIS